MHRQDLTGWSNTRGAAAAAAVQPFTKNMEEYEKMACWCEEDEGIYEKMACLREDDLQMDRDTAGYKKRQLRKQSKLQKQELQKHGAAKTWINEIVVCVCVCVC